MNKIPRNGLYLFHIMKFFASAASHSPPLLFDPAIRRCVPYLCLAPTSSCLNSTYVHVVVKDFLKLSSRILRPSPARKHLLVMAVSSLFVAFRIVQEGVTMINTFSQRTAELFLLRCH